jgi:hypothetical protein
MVIHLIVNSRLFCYYIPRGDDMNITEFIKSHKELNELPFLVVFRVLSVLREKGMLKEFDDVDRVSK